MQGAWSSGLAEIQILRLSPYRTSAEIMRSEQRTGSPSGVAVTCSRRRHRPADLLTSVIHIPMSINAIRDGFRSFFGDDGPELPDPPASQRSPAVVEAGRCGTWSTGTQGRRCWTSSPNTAGCLRSTAASTTTGSGETVGTFLDHYVYNAEIDENKDAARGR